MFSPISVVKEAVVGWWFKECFKFTVIIWLDNFWSFFSKNGVPRKFYLISATVKWFRKYLLFVLIDEKQVTGRFCLFGTSGWLPIVSVSDVIICGSCFQAMTVLVIIIKVCILSIEMDAPVTNREAISSLEGNFESVSFWEWIYKIRNQLVGVTTFLISKVTYWLQICLSTLKTFQCSDHESQRDLIVK